MDAKQPDWDRDLKEGLKEIADRYLPGRYPATIETQRAYDHALKDLEEGVAKTMNATHLGAIGQFDLDYRGEQLRRLGRDEETVRERDPDKAGQWVMREAQKGEREELLGLRDTAYYKETQEYKDRAAELSISQDKDRDSLDYRIRRAELKLDERFGLTRVRDDRDRSDR